LTPGYHAAHTTFSHTQRVHAGDRRLEEVEMLLAAKEEVNRGLDGDVHKLMSQMEDMNRRYASLGRRTSTLQVTSSFTLQIVTHTICDK
jgi:hypothetical protein